MSVKERKLRHRGILWLLKLFLPLNNGAGICPKAFPGGSVVKNHLAMEELKENVGSTPQLGRSTEKGNGNPLQYSCLENPMDRGAWQATVHGVTKSWT